MGLTAEEKREARSGNLAVDALEMTLKQSNTGAAMYSGPGQIRQTADGKIAYSLYDAEADQGFGWDNVPLPGSWIERDIDLEVRDWRGRTWTAKRTDVGTSHVDGAKGVVCKGEINEITLTSESYRSAGEFISLFFPVAMDIPYNKMTSWEKNAGGRKSYKLEPNIWEVKASKYKLRITKMDDGLEVEAWRDEGHFPSNFDTRLMESLWFVLARPIEWQVRNRVNKDADILTIQRRPQLAATPRLAPPLEYKREPDASSSVADMLVKYLEYMWDYDEPEFHPTSVNIRQTLLASATNVETEALALGIAVESFVRREFRPMGVPEASVTQSIKDALDFWQDWEGDPELKKRILTAVSGFKGSNPREAMRKLVAQGVITEAQLGAWNKIRHTTAHGMSFTADLRQVVRWCDTTHGALLRLIFSRIGYQGSYTDRSVEGWPTEQF